MNRPTQKKSERNGISGKKQNPTWRRFAHRAVDLHGYLSSDCVCMLAQAVVNIKG